MSARRFLPLLALLAATAAGAAPPMLGAAVMELDGRRLAITPAEQAAITRLGDAVRARRRPEQDAALAEARRVAKSPDARYALATYLFELGRLRRDEAIRAEALEMLLASGLLPPAKLAPNLALRGQIAWQARDYETANRHWSRLAELRPNDPDALSNLAQVRVALGDAKGADDLLARAAAARKAGGKPVSEAELRQRLSVAFNGGMAASGVAAAQALVAAYPSPRNWRDATVVYRQLVRPEGGFEIDLMRLMRSAGVLEKEAEYQRFAQLLLRAGEAAEAKAVLDEGIARKLLDPDVYPNGDIRAEIARALAKNPRASDRPPPGEPAASLVRSGAALERAGRGAEAEAAFKKAAAVPGPYGDLARFWLLRLARR